MKSSDIVAYKMSGAHSLIHRSIQSVLLICFYLNLSYDLRVEKEKKENKTERGGRDGGREGGRKERRKDSSIYINLFAFVFL